MNIEKQQSGMEYWKKVIIMLCLGWVTIWIYRSALTPIFPEIQETIGKYTNTQMGLISSCYFFGYTGMQIPAGILVDKLGKKKVLIPGFILFGLAAVMISMSQSISTIYIASVFAGIGCGSYYGSAYSLSSESIPEEKRGLSTAIINSGSAVGMGLGLIGSSLIVKQMGMPWQTMMYICIVAIIAMLVIFIVVIKPEEKTVKVVRETEQEVPVEKTKMDVKKLFSLKMITAYLLYFGTCYGYYMVVTWLPSFLQEERGFQGLAIGFSSALVAFSAIPGALFFSRLSDKHRNKKITFIFGLEIAAALMLLLTVLAPSSGILLVALILYGLLGKLAVEPIIISYIADSASKENYGTTFGVFNFFGMSSSVIAPALTGFISDNTGSKIMGFYISAIILVITTISFVMVNKNKKNA
ncbi:MFS transporter [Vagococcus carniphilus]|uniref:MFS transporter n=1 Tax=Vagococcus carniphilus TaxID=218144 RepID=A0AAW8U2T2_9ENTE|nr:MFS transporter [Vagococcus carniphilus]MDT2814276.1 MFS transporter [Vagococcus carniphilus]MDT2829394.1 MFS transporter [Vagococcus carniphilus]MDT2833399.1 MFS transporter [Vagococcus carniphilus]MDT2838853.1 MFS transporter [Vagococcus carniphilus]MDT2852911.1 MFS transporter [Vagococcus carniphilus]